MRKLYLKIVVAIWVVMLVSALASVVALRSTAGAELPAAFGDAPPWEFLVAGLVAEADRRTRGQGELALIDWFRQNALFSGPLALRILDENSTVLFETGSDGNSSPIDDEAMAVKTVALDRDGRSYTITVASEEFSSINRGSKVRSMLAFLAFRPEFSGLILLVAIPLSVLLSFLIAQYLVQPLRAFERAGAQLATGDFSARVSPDLGNRGDEIADFAATFDHMAARIQDLVRSHKHLLRDVSHELRTPLARVLAAASLARRLTQGEAEAEFERIELEVERLNTMISRLLTYAQLDAGQAVHTTTKLALHELLGSIVNDSLIEANAGDKRIELNVKQACFVNANREFLNSSIENVLRNAVRHTPDHSTIEITLSASIESGYCSLEIRDHGPGVAEDELPNIFKPFYRTDPARQPQIGGSGIGLAIAQKSIALHGGRIAARNAPDGGLIVTIELPLADHGD